LIFGGICARLQLPKFIHFHRVINFLGKCAFLDLADFWLIFRFFEHIEICAFISRKLNKLRGPFFTFPDNVTPSILIAKNIPSTGKVRGLQRQQIGLRNQNFKIVTYSRGSCDQTVRTRGTVVTLICTPEGPLVNAFTSFVGSLYPFKKCAPYFRQIVRGRGQILLSLYGDAQGPSGNKFW